MDKIRVYNPQKFDVGVTLLSNGLGINIKAKSFCLMTKDDIDYLMSISQLFQKGILKIEEDKLAQMPVVSQEVLNSPNSLDEEEIKKKLALTPKKLGEWLDTVTEPFMFDKICDIAKTMNLTMSKIKVLQEKMPDFDFMG